MIKSRIHEMGLTVVVGVGMGLLVSGCKNWDSDQSDTHETYAGTGGDCPIGHKGCPCTASQGCLDPLVCDTSNNLCGSISCVDGHNLCPCDAEGECEEPLSCNEVLDICELDCPAGDQGCPCGPEGACNDDLLCHPDLNSCEPNVQPDFPGHWVTCCYQGWFNGTSNIAYGCLKENQRACVDPSVVDVDNLKQLQDFCELKCDTPWAAGFASPPPWDYIQGGTQSSPDPNPPAFPDTFDACEAMPVSQAVQKPEPFIDPVDGFYKCNPVAPTKYGANGLDVESEFETEFGPSSENEVEVVVLGSDVTPSTWTLKVEYTVDSCFPEGIWPDDVGVSACRVVLLGLNLTTPSMGIGGFVLSDISLSLNRIEAADVVFTCGSQGCEGEFEFSVAEGNAIGTNLSWTQTNEATSTVDQGALHLTADGGLGGVDPLLGVLSSDSTGITLRLISYGHDIFGGDLASAEFDIVGDADRL